MASSIMEKIILQQSQNENQEAEIIPGKFSETIFDSVFKKFFLEVASLTIFTLRFFKELFKPPYEFTSYPHIRHLKSLAR